MSVFNSLGRDERNAAEQADKSKLIYDSGANIHIVNDINLFEEYEEVNEPFMFQLGDIKASAEGFGKG